jgi:hypothetical protein
MFRLSSFWLLAVVFVLAVSDRVDAREFGTAAPAVRVVQDVGGRLSLAADAALGEVLGTARSTGLPVSPVLLLGAGAAVVLDAVRARARRERKRRGGAVRRSASR